MLGPPLGAIPGLPNNKTNRTPQGADKEAESQNLSTPSGGELRGPYGTPEIESKDSSCVQDKSPPSVLSLGPHYLPVLQVLMYILAKPIP